MLNRKKRLWERLVVPSSHSTNNKACLPWVARKGSHWGLPPAGLGGGILAKSPFSEGLGIETTNCSRLPHREAMISEVTKKIYLGGVGV